ncbi:MAG TPA: DUF4412 domain-containing protein [Puia sp.]|nr:DUF4412 domain-containing protein [Puia sp.]
MKNILTLLSLALTLSGSAQNFEGAITWSVQYTSNDTFSLTAMRENLPKGYMWMVKDGNYRMVTIGSPRNSDLLWLAGRQQYYSLNDQTKTYRIPPVGSWARAAASDKPMIVNTREQRVILGYHCTKYIVTPKDNTAKMQTVYWMTTEIKGLDMKTMPTPGTGGNISQSPFHQDISGTPMMIEIVTPTMSLSIEAESVSRRNIPLEEFMVPLDFKESK